MQFNIIKEKAKLTWSMYYWCDFHHVDLITFTRALWYVIFYANLVQCFHYYYFGGGGINWFGICRLASRLLFYVCMMRLAQTVMSVRGLYFPSLGFNFIYLGVMFFTYNFDGIVNVFIMVFFQVLNMRQSLMHIILRVVISLDHLRANKTWQGTVVHKMTSPTIRGVICLWCVSWKLYWFR